MPQHPAYRPSRWLGAIALALLWGALLANFLDAPPSTLRLAYLALSCGLILLAWILGRWAQRAARKDPDRYAPASGRGLSILLGLWAGTVLAAFTYLWFTVASNRDWPPNVSVRMNLVEGVSEINVLLDQLSTPPETRRPGLPQTRYPPTPEGRAQLARDAVKGAMARLAARRNPVDGGPAFEVRAPRDQVGVVYIQLPDAAATPAQPTVIRLTVLIPKGAAPPERAVKELAVEAPTEASAKPR